MFFLPIESIQYHRNGALRFCDSQRKMGAIYETKNTDSDRHNFKKKIQKKKEAQDTHTARAQHIGVRHWHVINGQAHRNTDAQVYLPIYISI